MLSLGDKLSLVDVAACWGVFSVAGAADMATRCASIDVRGRVYLLRRDLYERHCQWSSGCAQDRVGQRQLAFADVRAATAGAENDAG